MFITDIDYVIKQATNLTRVAKNLEQNSKSRCSVTFVSTSTDVLMSLLL
jgi:hypothetical protein